MEEMVMRSFVVLFFVAACLNYFLQIPLLLTAVGALMIWVIWKLKYVILAILGLEMLFGGGDGGGIDV